MARPLVPFLHVLPLVGPLIRALDNACTSYLFVFVSLFSFECALNAVILRRVPYTEIDWIAYMDEVRGPLVVLVRGRFRRPRPLPRPVDNRLGRSVALRGLAPAAPDAVPEPVWKSNAIDATLSP